MSLHNKEENLNKVSDLLTFIDISFGNIDDIADKFLKHKIENLLYFAKEAKLSINELNYEL